MPDQDPVVVGVAGIADRPDVPGRGSGHVVDIPARERPPAHPKPAGAVPVLHHCAVTCAADHPRVTRRDHRRRTQAVQMPRPERRRGRPRPIRSLARPRRASPAPSSPTTRHARPSAQPLSGCLRSNSRAAISAMPRSGGQRQDANLATQKDPFSAAGLTPGEQPAATPERAHCARVATAEMAGRCRQRPQTPSAGCCHGAVRPESGDLELLVSEVGDHL